MRAITKRDAFNVVISAFFVANMIVPFLGLWSTGDGSIEKRKLATFPEFSPTKAGLENFTVNFGAFVSDHFGLRDNYLNLQSSLSQRIFGDSGSPKVIVGKGDWLLYAGENSLDDIQRVSHLSPDDLKLWKGSIDARAAWLGKQGITYRFVVPPDKHSVYGEELPARYSWHGPSRFHALKDYLESSPYLVDIGPAMRRHKEVAGERLYFHTDTHWTSYGAYVGYREIMASLSRIGLPAPISIPDSEFVNDNAAMHRDLAQMARLNRTESNQVPSKPIGPCGQPSQVMTPTGLDVSSILRFSGYTCPGKTKTALIFHDSFMESLTPYLNQEFGRVVYVWGEPNDEIFVRMVQQEHPDVVIEERVERSMQYVPKDQLTAALEKVSTPSTRMYTTEELLAQEDVYKLIRGHAELASDSQGQYMKVNGSVWARVQEEKQSAGSLDKFERTSDGIWATGWVGFPSDKERADYIVLTAGSRVIYAAPAKLAREDVADYFDAPALTQSGFSFVVPNEIVSAASGEIHAFALRGRKMVQIKISHEEMSSLL
ncbi:MULTISPECIES: alginate O-acetyltransferase AlgX-related protein [Paraburkholderia]|uniref:alginate O-acetyltransferase AlgX-related protein n=1 Tax=Paraburkholderia TaxID=1822464 RepID=UPI002256EBFC|nr:MULTISPECIES: hypothetical protein [Paraburkholderia]MCX4177459.1 hypothetical protein [Paraburkholderia madseniana]MDQ6465448.1 hypothetical protein [Paraburkholderia madseniana]